MITTSRFSFALFATLFLLALSTHAQTPTVSAINLTPDENKIRIAAVGDVLDMRVAVNDESGDVVFESGPVTGDHLDWTMSDPQGQRVEPGSYTLTVTYRTSNGKLKRRVEQVVVTEEVTGEARQQSAAPTPAAPVEGAGNPGKIAKFTAANTVGNSSVSTSSLTANSFQASGNVGQSSFAYGLPKAMLRFRKGRPLPASGRPFSAHYTPLAPDEISWSEISGYLSRGGRCAARVGSYFSGLCWPN